MPTITGFAERAQANADYFGVPYVVFLDASGNMRVERYNANLSCHRFNADVYYPARYDDSKIALLGE